jgi:pyrroline-5-carboxylate reductase
MKKQSSFSLSPQSSVLSTASIAVLGGGNMGGALVKGWLASRGASPRRITVADKDPKRLSALRPLGIKTTRDVRNAAAGAGVILLCVKPRQMDELLGELKGVVTARQLVVSIAAGLKTDFFEKRLGRVPVVRVMPNTPALYRSGASVYCLGRFARSGHGRKAEAIFASVGDVWKARESQMDAVTALSGSGPAYVFYLAECLIQAGQAAGLSAAMARSLARQTIFGAGMMLECAPEDAAELRRRVTSPGGTTEAALKVLMKAGLNKIFGKALAAASRRSRELSKVLSARQ